MKLDDFNIYHALIEGKKRGYSPQKEIEEALEKFKQQAYCFSDFLEEYSSIINNGSIKEVTSRDTINAVKSVLNREIIVFDSLKSENTTGSNSNYETKIKDCKHIITQDMSVINFHEAHWSYSVLTIEDKKLFQIILRNCNDEKALWNLGFYKKEDLEKIINSIKSFSSNSDSILIMPPAENNTVPVISETSIKQEEVNSEEVNSLKD